MAVRFTVGAKNASLDSGLGPVFDTSGRINVYTGTQPATADLAASGTLLGTLTLSADAFAAAASGAIAINAVTGDTSADATGTAGWVRFYRSTDTAPGLAAVAADRRMDLLIGTEISLDNVNIVAGGTINLTSYSLTHGG